MIGYPETEQNQLWRPLERAHGYGSAFNVLYILDNKIRKEAITAYGVTKINKEIIFYSYVKKHRCLPMPKFIEATENSYTMEYAENYRPLFETFAIMCESQQKAILERITNHLNMLHTSDSRSVTKDLYKRALQNEMIDKLESRYQEIKGIIDEYSFITSVNNIPIDTFEYNLISLKQKMEQHIHSRAEYIFNPIHGDCQFNNILYNIASDDIMFIDPRGYFGDNDIYGIPEYDFAKIKFALSGYGAFDTKEIQSLDIEGTNIRIDIPTLVPDPLKKGDFLSQLVVSIWMGNAHCFKENKFKTVYSYCIGAYYASLYL